MKRTKQLSETTLNSRVYRITTIHTQLYCPICGPNRGCNRDDRWGQKWIGGWKSKKIKKQWQRHKK